MATTDLEAIAEALIRQQAKLGYRFDPDVSIVGLMEGLGLETVEDCRQAVDDIAAALRGKRIRCAGHEDAKQGIPSRVNVTDTGSEG